MISSYSRDLKHIWAPNLLTAFLQSLLRPNFNFIARVETGISCQETCKHYALTKIGKLRKVHMFQISSIGV